MKVRAVVDQLDPVMRGLTFWMGYRRELYPHHPLKEGAIVCEMLGLMHSHLHQRYMIRAEHNISQLGGFDAGNRKLDIVLEDPNPSDIASLSRYVFFEIKRQFNGGAKNDLIRLKELKYAYPDCPAFLVICQQDFNVKGVHSKRWLTDSGVVVRRCFTEENVKYRVRRHWAITTLTGKLKKIPAVFLLEVIL
jgi:hypothetical protein